MEGHFLNIWENIEPKIREINWQFKVVFNILLIWIISLICQFVFIINSHQSLWKPINSKNDISSSVLQYVSQERLGSSQPDQNRRLQILLPRPPPPPPLCLRSLHPKLTGLAQLQLNKKGIASVKTQFTNMTSPLPWLEIWNIDLCAVKGLIKMITYTWGINAQKINRNFILDTRLSPMVKC